ncbi:hypothetical protein EDD66_102193 [Mobilisporobacter senegalensis]|uniref:Uncharacterized protein n=1 Tax=Mobilisporobacter senegalensis TaxID=1329262 RepID=A0A3N1XWF7_9FIRM|nr:hypothetical protein [Mobilisporobacter senegalensis]ROR30541.1 hypothetical protein EDD66_102193 [Mobilisporobacter senegalensis]
MNNLLSEVPIGFGMALAQDLDAMNYFANLDKQKQQEVINHTTQIHSREEMKQYVTSLSDHSSFK